MSIYTNSIKKFCCEQKGLLVFIGICIFFIYGVKLVNGNIGVDTERYLHDRGFEAAATIANGRYGALILEYLYPWGVFSIYTANFISVLLLGISAVLWLHSFSQFNIGGGQNEIANYAFALFYIASGVWVEVIYFTPYAIGYMLTVVMCPLIAYHFLIAIENDQRMKKIVCLLLALFQLTVYQAALPMLIGGGCIFIYLWHMDGQERLKKRKYFVELVKGCFAVAILYSLLLLLSGGLSRYLTNKLDIGNGMNPKRLLFYLYCLTCSNIHNSFIENTFISYTGESCGYIHEGLVKHMDVASIFFIPLVTFYIIMIKKSERKKRRVFLLCPLLIFFFPILNGGTAIVRTQWTIPLMTGWMIYYVLNCISVRWMRQFFAVISIICGVFLAERSAAVNYIDQLRYEEDVQLSYDIDREIRRLGGNGSMVDIWTVGAYSPILSGYEIFGETSGHSVFGWNGVSGSVRGIYFMNTCGMKYESLLPEKYAEKAEAYDRIVNEMPAYPDSGWVRIEGNVAFVKLSD